MAATDPGAKAGALYGPSGPGNLGGQPLDRPAPAIGGTCRGNEERAEQQAMTARPQDTVDLGDEAVELENLLLDGLETLRDLGADLGAFLALGDGVVDLDCGLLGGGGTTLSEGAYFVGHYSETGAGGAGAGGFDRGVEGEDVGLEGDLVDGLDDFRDVVGGGFDRGHRL
mgnify:CR=1 FL=1